MASSDDENSDETGEQSGADDELNYVANRLSVARWLEEALPGNGMTLSRPEPTKRPKSGETIGTTEREEDSKSALRAVELRWRNAQAANEEQDLKLRSMVAKWSIGFVCAQLLVANAIFAVYIAFNTVNPDAKIMIAWLTSSLIEVIGIVAVIARSLFPGGNAKQGKAKAKSVLRRPRGVLRRE